MSERRPAPDGLNRVARTMGKVAHLARKPPSLTTDAVPSVCGVFFTLRGDHWDAGAEDLPDCKRCWSDQPEARGRP